MRCHFTIQQTAKADVRGRARSREPSALGPWSAKWWDLSQWLFSKGKAPKARLFLIFLVNWKIVQEWQKIQNGIWWVKSPEDAGSGSVYSLPGSEVFRENIEDRSILRRWRHFWPGVNSLRDSGNGRLLKFEENSITSNPQFRLWLNGLRDDRNFREQQLIRVFFSLEFCTKNSALFFPFYINRVFLNWTPPTKVRFLSHKPRIINGFYEREKERTFLMKSVEIAILSVYWFW